MTDKKPVIGRREFIKGLMDAGFKFDQAVRAYDSFMSTISNGIVSGQAICLGNVGSVVPVVCPPKHVNMGCVTLPGGKRAKLKREFFLDTRLKYKFRLFKKFLERHQLDWRSS
jgi:hypothetical protein